MRMRVAVCALIIGLAAPPSLTAGASAPPAGACLSPAAPGQPITQVPWAQNSLAAERVWSFSRGRGVTVAVIDSGVDTDHPQLSAPGKVQAGFDFIRQRPGADFDCISHGTAVASIIAATPEPGIGFHGLAPDARILPVRVSDLDTGAGDNGNAVNPSVFAQAIRYAVDQGARVLNLSVVMYSDVAVVRDAIRYAEAMDAVVVAAAGNQHQDSGADPVPYPAGYPGVIGVGAITIDTTRLAASQVGNYVDLVAPGGGVLAATRQHGYVFWDGTSFATPFVSATAALVRAAYPQLNAAQVQQRLLATADPAAGGPVSPAYGHGVVDPYRAVTEGLDGANPAARPVALRTPTPDLAAAQRTTQARLRARHANNAVLVVIAVAAGVLLLVGIASLGRRPRRY
jgi:type VII secretion-associated serine protease mycosin